MLIDSAVLALMLTSSFDPRQLGTALIDNHPAFFQETPPYLSMMVVFLAGVVTTMLAQAMLSPRQNPVYDPAVQLESLPLFHDDLDIHEMKQEHYQTPY